MIETSRLSAAARTSLLAVLLVSLLAWSACSSSPRAGEPVEPDEPALAPLVECDVYAEEQQCCSAKNCTGKVLSNRDAHNCKTKSSGKSWHPASTGAPAPCTNL